eukprot:1612332-Rhodomonas_salina.2
MNPSSRLWLVVLIHRCGAASSVRSGWARRWKCWGRSLENSAVYFLESSSNYRLLLSGLQRQVLTKLMRLQRVGQDDGARKTQHTPGQLKAIMSMHALYAVSHYMC